MKWYGCSEQEQWVLEQLEEGEIADLKEQFGEAEENRRLRATFLEALLTDKIEGFKPRRQGIHIAQAVMREALDLGNGEVAHIVGLYNCVFQEVVNFQDARFNRHLCLDGSLFSKKAVFDRMQVRLGLLCRRTLYQGPVNFGGADIGGQFSADGAQFQNEKEEANFNSMKVGLDAFFGKTLFQGPVDFGNVDIGRHFSADGAQFQNEKEEANFNSMKVGKSAFFQGAVFQGPVDFTRADIGGQFSADGAQFLSTTEANLGGLKVGQSAFFRGAEFAGPVSLNHAHLLDLLMGGKPIPELNLQHTRVDRELRVAGTEINKIKASNLTVQGPAILVRVTIKEEADLRYARFQTLEFKEVKWPKKKGEIRLEGLTYQAISAGTTAEDHDTLLNWLDQARFHTQPYRQLEACWQQHGEQEGADKAFLRLKKRQAKENVEKGKFLSSLWVWFLILLAGYGRKPLRPLAWACAFYVFGLVAFYPLGKYGTQARQRPGGVHQPLPYRPVYATG